jgi:hypothetical protein
MRHDGFETLDVTRDRLSFTERLSWLSHHGEYWCDERREIAAHSVEAAAGAGALDWSIHLTNVRAEPLRFGSPTTAGRELAGYTGLHWAAGPLAAAHRTGEHLTALAFADQTHLAEATVTATTPSRRSGYGMRGRRDEYALDGATLPYGGE